MKRVVLHILLGLILVGCSKNKITTYEDNTPEDNTPEDDTYVEQTAVSFESNYDWPDSDSVTRGEAKTGFVVGDEIGVLAYYLENNKSISEVSPNFMYNQEVTYQQVGESFAWVYSPVKYWSNNTNDRLQFFTFYPYSIDNVTEGEEDKAVLELSSNTYEGYPSIYFKQAVALENQVDFMTSQTTQLEKCDVIPLTFSHQLTQVAFAVNHNGVSSDNVVVTELIITIDSVNIALEGTFEDTQFNAITTGEKIETLSYKLDGDYLLSGNSALIPTIDAGFYKTVSTDKGTLMLPPQAIGENCVTITATIDIDRGWDDGYVGKKVITLNVPSYHEYVAGEILLYLFTIDLETTELSFDIENILREVWKEGGEITEYTEDTEDTGDTEDTEVTIW